MEISIPVCSGVWNGEAVNLKAMGQAPPAICTESQGKPVSRERKEKFSEKQA